MHGCDCVQNCNYIFSQSKCKCENFVQFINDVLFIYDRLSLIFFFSKVLCVSALLADKGRPKLALSKQISKIVKIKIKCCIRWI